MKRAIVLIALSLFLCSTASAVQGGGGESTRNPEPTSKPKPNSAPKPRVEPRKRSSTSTPGVEVTTPSGLKYVDEVVGTGESPRIGRNVTVHYTGTLKNGARFENSRDPGKKPLEFVLGNRKVIKGLDEGVLTMRVGGKRRLIIPPNLGLGAAGRPPDIPPNATVIYEVELLSVGADHTTPPDTTREARTTMPRTRVGQAGIEFVFVPAGEFMMGSANGDADELPVHRVTIREGFYMGQYEVTQSQWQAVMGSNPSDFKGDNMPVERVSWDDAIAFIARLNAKNDDLEYRLPTEAEWEYACRAGTTGDYAGDLDAMGWYANNSGRRRLDADEISRTDFANYTKRIDVNGGQTHAVGTKLPNSFGLFDMHGNVWEWCQDWYHDSYNAAPRDGSTWMSGGEQRKRVLRGGSWLVPAMYLRSASRVINSPDFRGRSNGFRLVVVVRTR